jgi:hypothetical protein
MAWPANVPPNAELRASLERAHPWLADERFRDVSAGDCDRCGAEPRLVRTCGPGAGELGRACATEDDFCAGHADEGAATVAWLASLPEDADEIAVLWWYGTGELRYRPRYTPLK